MIKGGSIAKVENAITAFQSVTLEPMKFQSPAVTGRNESLLVNVSANTRSFQPNKKGENPGSGESGRRERQHHPQKTHPTRCSRRSWRLR